MKMRELILVNWGLVNQKTFSLPERCAFTGDTGAGKTSVIDAVVAIMTGASSKIGRFNSASEDGRGVRHRNATYRTLPSYILGGQDALFARTSAHGYAAIVFEPEDSEDARPFTAIVAASAVLRENQVSGGEKLRNAALERLQLIVIAGDCARLEDFFVPRADTKKECVPVEKIADVLKDLYASRKQPNRVTVHNFADEHRSYLKKVYGLLRGREEVSAEEAETAATAFSRFVSQEQIEDISKFVRSFVLPDPEQMDEIGKISDSMRKSRRLRDHAQDLNKRLELLEKALGHGKQFAHAIIRAKVMDEVAAKRDGNEAIKAENRLRAERKQHLQDAKNANATLSSENQRYDEVSTLRVALTAKLMGIPGYKSREILLTTDGELKLNAGALANKAITRIQSVDEFVRRMPILYAAAAGCADYPDLKRLLEGALPKTPPTADDLHAIRSVVNCIPADGLDRAAWEALRERSLSVENILTAISNELDGEEKPMRAEVAAAIASLDRSADQLRAELEQRKRDVALIDHGDAISYPRGVEELLDYIKTNMPEAKPAVLCDLVSDLRDESWQAAIEGYIGNSRYQVVVHPNSEKAVNRLLESAGLRRSSVIQGARALEESKRRTPDANSIVHELVIENPYAKAYLVCQFGGVIKVEDAGDLAKVPRGLTKAGRGSGGFSTFGSLAAQNDLTFGKRARQKRREAVQREIDQFEVKLVALQAEKRDLAELLRIETQIGGLSKANMVAICAEALETLAKISDTAKELEAIDVPEARALEKQLEKIVGDLAHIETNREKNRKLVVGAELKAEQCGNAILKEGERVEAAEARREKCSRDLAVLIGHAPWADIRKLREEGDDLVDDLAVAVQDIHTKRDRSLATLNELRGLLCSVIRDHNIIAAIDDAIDLKAILLNSDGTELDIRANAAFTAMSELVIQMEKLAGIIRNNKLAKLHAEMDEIAKDIRSAFSTHFCGRIGLEIKNAARVIDELNFELSGHRFGTDVYEFDDLQWTSKEYHDRSKFFESVTQKSADEDFDMFADGALASEEVVIRDELLALFMSPDEDEGRRRLAQFADYRNYKSYDLLKIIEVQGGTQKISLSRQMTGSGGEKETGLFVARVATISGAFRLRQKGAHLRAVFIDEFFKKTGEARIRQAIEYLSKTMGLQVIFAMPSRSFGPFKDLVHGEHNLTRVQSATTGSEVSHFMLSAYNAYTQEAVVKLRADKRTEVRRQAAIEFDRRDVDEIGLR